jgi:hypothetical protein
LTLDIACVPVLFYGHGPGDNSRGGHDEDVDHRNTAVFRDRHRDGLCAGPGRAAAKIKMTSEEKKAVSKACSDQASAKGLHGRDRQKFRAACIKGGGKTQ